MNRRIERYIAGIKQAKAFRRKAAAVMLMLSFTVSGNVFWLLHGIGTALTGDLICGTEEHQHNEECYQDVLVCGFEEDVDPEIHVHTESCYEHRLICEKQEHTHTEECYAKTAPEGESRSEWEASIPKLSGTASEDLVRVAASQSGYKENEGYTRYGDWYGNPTGDWNVMFVSFCLNYAGISEQKIPYGSGCWAWQVKLAEKDLFISRDQDKPLEIKKGDILFIDNDGDGKSDIAGIVFEISDSSISVIEGDVNGRVEAVTYGINDKHITGTVNISQFDPAPDTGNPETEAEPENKDETLSDEAGSEENTSSDETVPEETEALDEPGDLDESGDEEIETVEYSAVTDSGITVTAKAQKGVFDEGVVMTAKDVELPESITEEAVKLDDTKELKSSVAVDIKFEDTDGNEVEPKEGSKVDVVITIPEGKLTEGDEFALYHIEEDGPKEFAEAEVNETSAAFTTDGFSIYVVTAIGAKEKDEINESLEIMSIYGDSPDGRYICNKPWTPYILFVGDTVVLEGRSVYEQRYFFNYEGSNVVELAADSGNNREGILSQEDNTYYCRREFRANAPGSVEIKFDTVTDGTKSFFLEVRQKNSRDYEFDLINNGDLVFNRNPDNPIELHLNETFTIEADTSWVGSSFYFIDRYRNPISSSEYIEAISEVKTGTNVFTQDFKAVKYSGNDVVGICVQVSDSPDEYYRYRYIYFKVISGDALDHADIEVADDGTDTASKIYTASDGLYKTVITRKTYVSEVNKCVLYDKKGEKVTFYHDEYNGSEVELMKYPGIHGYEHDDYWQDPNLKPGDAQYELTSKYVLEKQGDNWVVVKWTNKKFFYDDVYSAVFNVKLELRPVSEITLKYNPATGDWDPVAGTERVYTEEEGIRNHQFIDNVEYTLNRRAVIDAYNKCPNHTGLDFTVRSSTAVIMFEANKELQGGELADDQFTFEIYDPNTNEIIATAKNKGDGRVVFEDMFFDQAGTYSYMMREVNTGDSSIVYDTSVYPVTIDVNVDDAGILTPDFSSEIYETFESAHLYKFKNYKKFRLPDTGGPGTAMYLSAGAAMIAGAMILMFLQKRKEVDL